MVKRSAVSGSGFELKAAIDVRALSKRYGAFEAVKDVSFSLRIGEVLGFLGPNGAGKSTTMKMVAGYVPVTSGEVRVLDRDIQVHPIESRGRIGYLPEGSPLYGEMTVSGFLDFVGAARGLSRGVRKRRMAEVTAMLELGTMFHQRIETLSKGFKRRVGLAQAVLHDPDILILDEPTDGLDPNQKFQVRKLIRAMGRSKAIIISTHLLEEVDAVCDRAIIIDHGQLVFSGSPAELRSQAMNHNAVTVRVSRKDRDQVTAALQNLDFVASIECADDHDASAIVIRSNSKQPIAAPIGAALRDLAIPILDLQVETGSLDEVFRDLTTAARTESN